MARADDQDIEMGPSVTIRRPRDTGDTPFRADKGAKLVGVARIELATPAMSMQGLLSLST